MYCNSETNNKIKIASLICTFFVLYRHSLNYLAFFGTLYGYGLTGFIEDSVSRFTEIAVPYFFIISGLFFFKYDYYQKGEYISMLKKKMKSLVLPFLIWNIFVAFILLFYDLEKVGTSFHSIIYNLATSNWNGPLWYIRDLIIIMFLVPIYLWIFKVDNKWLYLIIFFVLYYRWWPIDTSILSTECQLFFFIGGVLRKNYNILSYRLPKYILILLIIIWCLNCFDLIHINGINYHKINTIIGIIVFWNILNYIINKHILDILFRLSKYSFIIYAMHFYIEKLLKQTIAYFFYGNNFVALLTYILVPFICVVIIVFIAKKWKMVSSRSYNIVTGGR